jgi:AP-1-like factor
LKAQVERLTIELKEYRKRLSFIGNASGGLSRSPTAPSGLPSGNSRTSPSFHNNNFQFEFPKFGDLPGAHIFNNGSFAKAQDKKPVKSASVPNYSVPGVVSRNSVSSTSPRGQAPTYGSTGNSPVANGNGVKSSSTNNYGNIRQSTGIDGLQDLFSPSILESATRSSSFDYMSHPGSSTSLNQTSLAQANNYNYQPVANGGSTVSNTDSPSASSESQHGAVSSIGTSPEPSLNSPSTGKFNDFGLNTINEERSGPENYGGEKDFYRKLSMACGDCKNPVPRAMSLSNGRDYPLGPAKTPASDINGIDWLAQQNGGQFDPVLFGGYRDSQDSIVGQDFGSFFNDAFPLPDLGSPFNNLSADVPSPAPALKRDLMKEIEDTQNGADEEVVPGEDRSKMLSCNKIWYVRPFCTRLVVTDRFSFPGIDYNQWTRSRTANLIWTIFVVNSELKRSVRRVERWLARRTSMTSSNEPRQPKPGRRCRIEPEYICHCMTLKAQTASGTFPWLLK